MPAITQQDSNGLQRVVRFNITAAEIVALGASTTGTITLPFNLPPKAIVSQVSVWNGGTAAATLTSLTATVGDSGDNDRYFAAQSVFAANAGLTQNGQSAATNASATAVTALTMLFTGNADLDGLTGLTNGVNVTIWYMETV